LSNHRLIARLDIKGSNLIKGIHLEGLRKIGDPNLHAEKYYNEGADELLYMDVVASLYGRNNLTEIVKYTAENVFIPLTVGGGIRKINDVKQLLRSGADKVAINTAAIENPNLLSEIANRFGSQCLVLSVEAKKIQENEWEAYTNNGRERTGVNVIDWVQQAVALGVGEILVTSIDMEGTRKGFDVELVKTVSENVPIPVIASGGMGSMEDLSDVIINGKADAVAMADMIHYNRASIQKIRDYALSQELDVRSFNGD
jgi:imidazole glycerol-phosphate synthase subunit HisF